MISTDAEQEEIIEFANKITPSNWHICSGSPKDWKYEPGILNIILDIDDQDIEELYDLEDEEDDIFVGQVWGKMRFMHLKNFGIDRKGKIAMAHIVVRAAWGDLLGTIVHELAHVAVDRYAAFKTKTYKTGGLGLGSYRDVEEDMHGPIFQKALWLIVKRAVKKYGYQIPEEDFFWSTAISAMFKYMPETRKELREGKADIEPLEFRQKAFVLVKKKANHPGAFHSRP